MDIEDRAVRLCELLAASVEREAALKEKLRIMQELLNRIIVMSRQELEKTATNPDQPKDYLEEASKVVKSWPTCRQNTLDLPKDEK